MGLSWYFCSPLCWKWAATGVTNSLKRCSSTVKQHQGCSQWFMSRNQGWACLVRAARMLSAWWELRGGGACTNLDTHTSLWSVWGGPCKQPVPLALWLPILCWAVPLSPSSALGSAQQWLPACRFLAVPDVCDDCSGIFVLPYYKKGSPFTIFLFKIWSCLVVITELLGSVGSPKCSSLFGPRLLLCEYML